jgi:hypothetical protein
MIENDLPSAAVIIALFEGASVRRRAHEIVTQVVAANWQEFADKLAPCADFFLTRLYTLPPRYVIPAEEPVKESSPPRG